MKEAAARLGVHVQTLRKWGATGVLRVVRLPGSGYRRVPLSEVERLEMEFGEQRHAVLREPAAVWEATPVKRGSATGRDQVRLLTAEEVSRYFHGSDPRPSDYEGFDYGKVLGIRSARTPTSAESEDVRRDRKQLQSYLEESGLTFDELMRQQRGRHWDR
jgi:excisionase family DNA binding protein